MKNKKHLNSKELFSFTNNLDRVEVKSVEQKSAIREATSDFFKNKLAVSGLVVFIILIATAFIASFTSSHDILIGDSSKILLNSSSDHWFGTDEFGRDLWTRLWYGVWISATLALVASIINVVIASLVGIAMGYFENFDKAFSPIIKIMYSMPTILVLILFSVVFQSSSQFMNIIVIVISLTVTGWVGPSQQIRANTLRVKNQDFITASQTLGTGKWKIFGTFFNLAIPVIIIQFTMLFPRMILAEATLGFLGLSIPDLPTLGTLVNTGRSYILTNPMQIFYPIIFLVTIVGSVQFAGFGIETSFGSSRTGR